MKETEQWRSILLVETQQFVQEQATPSKGLDSTGQDSKVLPKGERFCQSLGTGGGPSRGARPFVKLSPVFPCRFTVDAGILEPARYYWTTDLSADATLEWVGVTVKTQLNKCVKMHLLLIKLPWSLVLIQGTWHWFWWPSSPLSDTESSLTKLMKSGHKD